MNKGLVLLGILVLFGAVFSAGMGHREVSYRDNDKVAEIWHDSSKMATVEIRNSMEKRGGLNYLTDCGILTCSLYLSVSAESAMGISGAASNLHATYAGTYYKSIEPVEIKEPIYEFVEEEYTYEECANTTIEEDGRNETSLECTESTGTRTARIITGYETHMEMREVWKEEPGRFGHGPVEVRIDFVKDDPAAVVDLFAVVDNARIERWAWWDSSWLYKVRVNLTSGVEETLNDYPAHFQLDTATLIGDSKMQSDCGDLRVVSCDESGEVPFEMEYCNQGNTDIYARATLEPSPALNCVYVYYGNPGAEDGQDTCNVWSNNFTRVYHFEEPIYSGSMFDSSCHANGSYNGTGYMEDGIWGNGVRLYANSVTYVEFPNTYEWADGNASFSIWAIANSSQYVGNTIFSLVSAYTDRTGLWGWSVKLYPQNIIANARMADVIVESQPSGDTSMTGKWNSWMLWSVSQNFSGYGSAMFVNGSLVATQANSAVNNGYPGVHIGNDYIYQNRAWRGAFDEYRESNVTRSANWTMAEFLQDYVVGNEEYPESTLARTSMALSPSTLYIDVVDVTCSVSYDSSVDEEFTASMGLAINGVPIGEFNVTNSTYQNKVVWNQTFSVEDYTPLGSNLSCWSEAHDIETTLEIAYTENKSITNLVPGCMVLDEAGTFELEGGIYGAEDVSGVSGISSACVIINHGEVTLNCSGYSMDANNTPDSAGILVNATGALITNCPSISSYEKGIYFQNVQQGAAENTSAYNSTEAIAVYASSGINLTGCISHNSTKGIMLDGATGIRLEGNIFFGNGYDFHVGNSNYTMLTNYFTPDGTFTNYTNLSVADAVTLSGAYMVSWSANPGVAIAGTSFAQKFINITTIGGTPSIDELNWSWSCSESLCYKEETLNLHHLNSTGGWTLLNDTPDTANNVLTLYDLEPEGVYGIFDNNLPPGVGNVTLNTTNATNSSLENLTLYMDSYDPNGNRIKNITNWYYGNNYKGPNAPTSSITALNMPFEGGSCPEYTKDYSNHSYNGTVVGATWNATGGHDGYGAYHFDGDDYITASDSLLNLPRGYTMSAWFNTSDKSRDHFVLSWGSNTPLGARSIFVEEGTGYFSFSGYVETYHTSVDVADGEWHLLNAVHASDDMVTFYVDGEYAGGDGLPLTQTITYTETVIGADPDKAQNANATIDDVVIFNRALSAEQIQALYENRTDIIVPEETELSDKWYTCVTPNDGTLDGNETCSNDMFLSGITSCMQLNSIANYTLVNDIYGAPFELDPSMGVLDVCLAPYAWATIDCNGHSIINDGTPNAAGVILRDYGENTRDCAFIAGYEVGIYFHGADHSEIRNVTTANSTGSGIYIYSSEHISIVNSTLG
ncbi:right-handed parallel beta-helix repeat-containing protein [Candidatus Micrarchaeota archaeon]|nr:right-handed parallel beta-helix repeat-containing protein [Candidatus Micrarchaeota archaeon]